MVELQILTSQILIVMYPHTTPAICRTQIYEMVQRKLSLLLSGHGLQSFTFSLLFVGSIYPLKSAMYDRLGNYGKINLVSLNQSDIGFTMFGVLCVLVESTPLKVAFL